MTLPYPASAPAAAADEGPWIDLRNPGRVIPEAERRWHRKSYAPADLSGIESRIMSRLMTEPYGATPENGVDVHTATAADAFGVPANEVTREQREWAKARNYMRMYGWQSTSAPITGTGRAHS